MAMRSMIPHDMAGRRRALSQTASSDSSRIRVEHRIVDQDFFGFAEIPVLAVLLLSAVSVI